VKLETTKKKTQGALQGGTVRQGQSVGRRQRKGINRGATHRINQKRKMWWPEALKGLNHWGENQSEEKVHALTASKEDGR